MFDIGWSEMAVIMLVAIIVIGPKDLPRVARSVGKWTAKARAMARDFQRSLDDMAREADLDEIKNTIAKADPTSLKSSIQSAVEKAVDLDDKKSGTAKPATKPETKAVEAKAPEVKAPEAKASAAAPAAAREAKTGDGGTAALDE